MKKPASFAPSFFLALAVVSFFTALAYHEFKTLLISGSIVLSATFIVVTWQATKNRGRLGSYKGELVSSGLLFGVSILLSFLSLGGFAPLLIWVSIYSLALSLYVLDAQFFDQLSGTYRSIKRKAFNFTFVTFVLCLVLNWLVWDVPKAVTLEMEWRYGAHVSKECRAPDCKTIIFRAVEHADCRYELQIDSPDLGKYLEAYGKSVVPVTFEVRYGGEQVNTKKIGELVHWKSYWGTSGGRAHCFDRK